MQQDVCKSCTSMTIFLSSEVVVVVVVVPLTCCIFLKMGDHDNNRYHMTHFLEKIYLFKRRQQLCHKEEAFGHKSSFQSIYIYTHTNQHIYSNIQIYMEIYIEMVIIYIYREREREIATNIRLLSHDVSHSKEHHSSHGVQKCKKAKRQKKRF